MMHISESTLSYTWHKHFSSSGLVNITTHLEWVETTCTGNAEQITKYEK